MADPHDTDQFDDDWPDHVDTDLDDPLDDATEVVRCPACGADVYEDAEQCPSCGDYIVHDTSEWSGRSWWWVALGLAGIVAVLYWLLSVYGLAI